MCTMRNNPIGVFDSGLGGISVLRELIRYMPDEDYIYIGDSVHAPYGTKTVDEVRELTVGHIRTLTEDYRVKAIAVACNTATSAAVRVLREMYPSLPLVGVEPALKPAVLAEGHPRVLVMATPRTLKEKKFKDLFHLYEDRAKIYPLPCPGLMEYVERGILNGSELDDFLRNLLSPFTGENLTGIVLGCTHYPFLKETISAIVGPDVALFDGGEGTARELKRRIKAAGSERNDPGHHGRVFFINTSNRNELLDRSSFLFSYQNPHAATHEIVRLPYDRP